MTIMTRRTLLKTGTAAGAAAALTGPALLDWAKAWAQAAPWKPEKGAKLSMLRWKYFVQSEDDAFVKLIETKLRFLLHRQLHHCETGRSDRPGAGGGEIDNSSLDVRTAVIDADHD